MTTHEKILKESEYVSLTLCRKDDKAIIVNINLKNNGVTYSVVNVGGEIENVATLEEATKIYDEVGK